MTGIFPKKLALIVLIVSTACVTRAQNCSLKLAELPAVPELFGFRLGMTTDQVKAHVPQVKFGRSDEFALAKTTINPHFDPTVNPSSFAGVRSISLDFLDGRLTSLWLGYDDSFKWQTLDDFVAGISKSMNLPSAWEQGKSRGRRLRCADFEMTVTILGAGPSFRILDSNAEQTLTARREAKAEQEAGDEAVTEQPVQIIADRSQKIYYPEGCETTEIKPANRVVFSSPEEAEKSGYKPSKSCR